MRIESIGAEGGVFGPSSAGATLVVTLEGKPVQTVILGERVVRIGRLPDNELVLSHPNVSRHHAEVRVAGGDFVLTDVASSSGTFVGAARLQANQPCKLESGTVARIGPFELTLIVPVAEREIP